VSEWVKIRYLSLSQGMSGRAIAGQLGVAREAVRRALASPDPPKYVREPVGSKVDPFVPRIRALLVNDPSLRATVLAERVGFNDGVCTTVFRARVREIKAQLGVVDPADRLVFAPGEQIQCDLWFPDSPVAGSARPVLTMTCCWSRFIQAVMIPTRTCGDILAGMNLLLERFGGLPDKLLWDNEAGIVHARRLISQACAWAGGMGLGVKLAKPKDPETKGRIERANGYLGTSFEPARSFASIDDFNAQLADWLDTKANRRWVRAAGARPIDLLDDERAAMRILPDPMPRACIEQVVRLSRDYYVRVGSYDYSVDPAMIGRLVTVTATLDRVQIVCDQRVVADHARCFIPHQVVTDPVHVEQAKHLRQQFQDQARHATHRPTAPLVEQRDLASYDDLYHKEQAA